MGEIFIIKSLSVNKIDQKDINVEVVGQKTMGLLRIPSSWRLPFFILHKEIYEDYIKRCEKDREEILSYITKQAEKLINYWEMPKVESVIIRSSGASEGMLERGKYESQECKISEIKNAIKKLYSLLEKENSESIAYVIQPFVERKKYGHLSNERRVSRDRRDWKLEYEDPEQLVDTIGVRKWRTEYEEEVLISRPLYCEDQSNIKDSLRRVAYYYSEFKKNERLHLEFVWDGKVVYIVQNDREEKNEKAENPMLYPIKINDAASLDELKVFRKINHRDAKRFRKVENVILYEELGLTIAPLYIIDDKEIILSLEKGMVSEELKKDIELLTSKSMVIRTDVDKEIVQDGQFFPRSNELRNYQSAIIWFKENLCKITHYNKIAIIAHIFIPAISAAFAYATPKNKIVTVQSLWGLPEGLYYNAHDTFLLDTGTRDVKHINEDKIKITNFQADFKEVYIAPDDKGKWGEKIVKEPYDWRKSITNKQAKTIAKGSRLIAQKVGIPVSVMWFVGIDKEYYGVDCLPWFHEKYGNNTFSHDTYKKKYFTEKEIVITNERDLEKYENDTKLRTITIHPKDDEFLRSRDFLSKVGEFAKRKKVTIFLEGTILAHPVYRLMDQGVRVVLSKRNKELIDKMQFDKLVRDKIPNKIINNMEDVRCYRANDTILIRYLKEKLIEEVYEVIDADNKEDLCEELADVYEVLCNIKKRIHTIKEIFSVSRTKKVNITGQDELIANITNIDICNPEIEKKVCSNGWKVTCNIDRIHQNIEFEIKLNKKAESAKKQDHNYNKVDREKKNILEMSYQILDEKDSDKIMLLCNNIINEIIKQLKYLKVSKKDFTAICTKKNNKNGGFEEGFILQETGVYTEMFNEIADESQMEIELEHTENYPQLRELLFSAMTYIDFRKSGGEELLIRIKYPLCFEEWENEFSGAHVENMFGINTRVVVYARRKKCKYSFKICLRRNNFEQLSFNM